METTTCQSVVPAKACITISIHRVCAGDVEYISTGSHTPVECFVIWSVFMQTGYSVRDQDSDVTEFSGQRWVRVTREVVRCSERVELDLITAGGVTDPQYYVDAVDEFRQYLRLHSTPSRSGHGWRFTDTERAALAYQMLCRICRL